MKLSAQQEQDLFDGMDLDKDGTISYTEFVVFVRDPCHPFLEQKVRCMRRIARNYDRPMRRTL